jgi:hypothetical protein
MDDTEQIDYAERDRRESKSLKDEYERAAAKVRGLKQARKDAGMGFWRLVWIVAFGILIAQSIGGLLLWIVAKITTP